MKALAELFRMFALFIDMLHIDSPLREGRIGRFHVLYHNGRKSRPGYYDSCRTLAQVYGGQVVHNRTGRVVWQSPVEHSPS